MSAEKNEHNTQEQELWDRISTTEGAERAEVLDELSHIAYNRNNYIECLSLIETSIDIYFSLHDEFHTKEFIHLYEGKAFCLSSLDKDAESAEAFETLAGYYCIDEDRSGFIRAKRNAGREWFSAKNYQKSLECHTIASQELDIDATDYTMGIDNLNIGTALQKLGRHEEAVTSILTARSLFKKDKNPEYVNWADRQLAESYIELRNGFEAKFHAQHYFNFTQASENLDMEGLARFRLGQAHWLLKEYEQAEREFVRALELLTLEGDRDWPTIVQANNDLAAALFAQGKDEAAKTRLNCIATIEETLA